MLVELESGHLPVFTREVPRSEQETISLWNPRRKLRYLYLIKATQPYEAFAEEGNRLVNYFLDNPILGYEDFAGDLAKRVSEHYETPQVEFLSDLPNSANAITIVNENGHEREIPDFPTLLRRKIASRFPWNELRNRGLGVAFSKENEDEVFALMEDLIDEDRQGFEHCLAYYQMITPELLRLLGESIEKIKQLPPLNYEPKKRGLVSSVFKLKQEKTPVGHTDPEVYHGRDGRYLYLARKADRVGQKMKPELGYVVSSRILLNDPNYEQYVKDCNLPRNAYHIDTWADNFQGARKVLSILGEDQGVEDEHLQKRFKAIVSMLPGAMLFPERDHDELVIKVGALIENTLPYKRPSMYEKNWRTGKLEMTELPEWVMTDPIWAELRLWSLEQAIKRHFLPKKSKNNYTIDQ